MKHFEKLSNLEKSWGKKQSDKPFDPNNLDIESAKAFIQEYIQPLRAELSDEQIPLESSLGRILSQPIVALHDVPSANNSAMDGYAFASAALQNKNLVTLEVFNKQFAGQAIESEQFINFDPQRHVVRIMTGGLVPPECDSVIAQELVAIEDQYVRFDTQGVERGQNLRFQGEEIQAGDVILNKGKCLSASDLGLIASLGYRSVQVYRKIRIAYFSTGNELTPPGEPLPIGHIYDSNRFILLGLLDSLGCIGIDLGMVRDETDLLRAKFHAAIQIADVIITSGGMSVGEADFTKTVMNELGDVAFWSLAIKPGRPIAFGQMTNENHSALLFGLPGNPVAMMVTFTQLVKDMLLYLGGSDAISAPFYCAKLDGTRKKRLGRTEFLRGVLYRNSNDELWVRPHENQGSGALRSISESDCFIILQADIIEYVHGQSVDISAINN